MEAADNQQKVAGTSNSNNNNQTAQTGSNNLPPLPLNSNNGPLANTQVTASIIAVERFSTNQEKSNALQQSSLNTADRFAHQTSNASTAASNNSTAFTHIVPYSLKINPSNNIVVNLRECRYDIFRKVSHEVFKWETLLPGNEGPIITVIKKKDKETAANNDENDAQTASSSTKSNNLGKRDEVSTWDINWFDNGGLTPEWLSTLLPWQRVNHFLGMYNISRKNTLGIHLRRFKKEFPRKGDYDFFPVTWLYPTDFYDINEYYQQKLNKFLQKNKQTPVAILPANAAPGSQPPKPPEPQPGVIFICKPEASSQGRGIYIFKKVDEMRQVLNQQLQNQQKQFREYIQAQQHYDTAACYSYTAQNASIFLLNGQQQQQTQNVNQENPQLAVPNHNQIREPPQAIEKNNTYVVQKYIKHPALIDGHKFDFRIYVLVTSVVDPLTIFLYDDGLVRLASEKYNLNLNKVGGNSAQDHFMHLTNYSLNKKNKSNFDGIKHKLSLAEVLDEGFNSQHPEKGTFNKTAEQLWEEIEDIVIKTVITVQPQLQHYYRSCQPREPDLCYELLGFDIMLDRKLKPWLLEVNHLPSFNHDTPIDKQVKTDLIRDMFTILQMSVEHRKRAHYQLKQEQKAAIQSGGFYKRLTVKEHLDRVRFNPNIVSRMDPGNGFKLIFPRPEEEDNKYEKFLKKAHEIWQVTTGTMKANNNQTNPGIPKKKKKPKKKAVVSNVQVIVNPNEIDPALADGGDEGGGGDTPFLDQEIDNNGNLSQRAIDVSCADLQAHQLTPTHEKRHQKQQSTEDQQQPSFAQDKRIASTAMSKSTNAQKDGKISAKQVTQRLYPQNSTQVSRPANINRISTGAPPLASSGLGMRQSYGQKPNLSTNGMDPNATKSQSSLLKNKEGQQKNFIPHQQLSALDQFNLIQHQAQNNFMQDENFINNFGGVNNQHYTLLFHNGMPHQMVSTPTNGKNVYKTLSNQNYNNSGSKGSLIGELDLRNNQQQLKYKEYCRGLFEETQNGFNLGANTYYRTSSASGQGINPNQDSPQVMFSNSQLTNINSAANHKSTALIQAFNHVRNENTAKNQTQQLNVNAQQNVPTFQWNTKNNQQFVQKLKNVIQLQNQQAPTTTASRGGMIIGINPGTIIKVSQPVSQLPMANNGKSNGGNSQNGQFNGSFFMGASLVSPTQGTPAISVATTSNPNNLFQMSNMNEDQRKLLLQMSGGGAPQSSFQGNHTIFKQSVFKNEQLIPIPQQPQFSQNHQRIILRCESTQATQNPQQVRLDQVQQSYNSANGGQAAVDIVPINMSACIFDMKAPISSAANNHVNLTDQMSQLNIGYKRHNRRLQSSNLHHNIQGNSTKGTTQGVINPQSSTSTLQPTITQQQPQLKYNYQMKKQAQSSLQEQNNINSQSSRQMQLMDDWMLSNNTNPNMHPALQNAQMNLSRDSNTTTNFVGQRTKEKPETKIGANKKAGINSQLQPSSNNPNALLTNFYLSPPTANHQQSQQSQPSKKILFVENSQAYEANLDKLKEYEKRLLNHAQQQQQKSSLLFSSNQPLNNNANNQTQQNQKRTTSQMSQSKY